ncbi:MAG: hypothetical protein ACRELA_21125 [Candidatus Rokuibacteriota bacterium]
MSDADRLERRLGARLGRAIADFGLIEPGDRILQPSASPGPGARPDGWPIVLERAELTTPVLAAALAGERLAGG